MLLTFFCTLLAAGWLTIALIAFCPLRASRRRALLTAAIRMSHRS